MKKKMMLTVLSSVLAVGFLGACGEVDNEELNDGMNDGMENNMEDNDL
ncbi:hypothetical protein [Salisediminibacterium halotolerans]|uniref:Uncharacterized protein n=1 Tax=Salisediminibacterium halotolerans TaxID=517425 RepID=A0A1H9QK21_9BACI|nr:MULTISPECIES: hypothetical protein [Salisediminibacterium]RLJ75746.1 hypothetical protein BCL39_1264 [Actinophytocola xinjiangensis]RPE89600.1 hypothetical protein EDD67_0377 [Salisediminibacterium halotolerans]TWG36359.1 hypothetical protein BCL52_1261 [Salisediminibacterium halotolerans]SER60768.1 hypothetical protein SAMN05444126_10347 [Salisediminibacterium haloalkalitolerans]GEL09118.1 hypothetical protein SHA02_25340 [Salisediminibacterium halotolerans]